MRKFAVMFVLMTLVGACAAQQRQNPDAAVEPEWTKGPTCRIEPPWVKTVVFLPWINSKIVGLGEGRAFFAEGKIQLRECLKTQANTERVRNDAELLVKDIVLFEKYRDPRGFAFMLVGIYVPQYATAQE
ncbi:MAG: hypothetical protein ABIG71_02945 [Candidatus Uhrbacteria bacterium]